MDTDPSALRKLFSGEWDGLVTSLPATGDSGDVHFAIGTTVEEAEKGLILRTLDHTNNNKTRAAEILGISLKTLHNKLKEYGAREIETGA